MGVIYAKELKDVMNALRPEPLRMDELDRFFEETGSARDSHLEKRDEIYAHLNRPENVKILVTGHAGTGKSTELVKFQREHEDQFAFISFSMIKEAQLSQASVEALLVLIVETIVRTMKNLDLTMNERTLDSVYNWFSETFEIEEDDLKYSTEVGAEADSRNTVWGKMLGLGAWLKADIRTGSYTLHKTITKENRRLSELAHQCNLLIREAKLTIKENLKKEMVLIIEDFDKTPMQAADEIFIQNPAPLADLECKAIYTAPIWLLHNPRAAHLDSIFTKINIPMIKIWEQNGEKCSQGHEILREVLQKRMNVDTLMERSALELAIGKTGGILRHLFNVIITASLTALQMVRKQQRSEPKIGEMDIRYGLNQLRADLVRRLGVFGLPKEYESITVEELYAKLREVKDKPQRLESDPVTLLLLQAHAVIEYNGEGWHSVHPLVVEHLNNEQ